MFHNKRLLMEVPGFIFLSPFVLQTFQVFWWCRLKPVEVPHFPYHQGHRLISPTSSSPLLCFCLNCSPVLLFLPSHSAVCLFSHHPLPQCGFIYAVRSERKRGMTCDKGCSPDSNLTNGLRGRSQHNCWATGTPLLIKLCYLFSLSLCPLYICPIFLSLSFSLVLQCTYTLQPSLSLFSISTAYAKQTPSALCAHFLLFHTNTHIQSTAL